MATAHRLQRLIDWALGRNVKPHVKTPAPQNKMLTMAPENKVKRKRKKP